MDTPPHHHRRDFVKALAAAAPVALIGTPALAEDPPKDDKKPEEAKPKTEADARMEVVLARFGKQLDEAARKTIRGEVEAIVRRAEALRKFELDNGDGPYPIFQPYRAPLS